MNKKAHYIRFTYHVITEDIFWYEFEASFAYFFCCCYCKCQKKKRGERDWSKLMREGAQLARAF